MTSLSPPKDASDSEPEPRVWAIMCYRQGDNSQILALAEALGWPFEVKRLEYQWFGYAVDVWRGTTLLGIDRHRSSPLDPPWPDLIISASMRNEPVCRWIRKESGGVTRYVHMGRPWARLESFDLVVTSPEFRLRKLANVHHNALTLTRVTVDKLREAAAAWTPRLAHLPRPRIAVLVGGYGGPYALDPTKAQRLGREASAMARAAGGSLLVTTSARTKRSSVLALRKSISVPCHFFRWAGKSVENPFYGYLALADAFIVTCDSASMLAEACATRRPVYMFDLGPDPSAAPQNEERVPLGQRLFRRWRNFEPDRLKALIYRQMLKVPPRRMTRDIRLIHQFLIEERRAVWLGQPFPAWTPPPLDEMTPTVARVRSLLCRASGASGHLETVGCQPAANLPTSL